jgi:hypothetical protein
MKRLLVFVLAMLVVVPCIDARRKKKRAGMIEGTTFIDGKHGFSLSIHDNWKPTVQNIDDRIRIVTTQKQWQTPPRFQGVPGYTQVPRYVIWADTSSMGVFPFIDSLVSDSYKSEQKSDMLREFEFFLEGPVVPLGQSPFKMGDVEGLIWRGRVKYVHDIEGTFGHERVEGGYGAAILAAKKADLIVVMYTVSEEEYIDAVLVEVREMAGTFRWKGEEKVETGAGRE